VLFQRSWRVPLQGDTEVHCYNTYGLTLHSEIPLPELLSEDGTESPDAVIQFGSVGRYPIQPNSSRGCFLATSEEAFFHWPEYGTYLVKEGRTILVEPSPQADERMLRLVILGVAMGVLLHQRGILTLHASAVCIHGAVVAFVANKKGGKSTTAAALHALGHAVVADDIVAVDTTCEEASRVIPGFPQLKIWPDVAKALGKPVEEMPRLHPKLNKLAHLTDHDFPLFPLPLKRIYILREHSVRSSERVQTQSVFLELMRHSYAVRFLGSVGATPSHFQRIMKVANHVPISVLNRPTHLEELQDLARWIEQQAMAPEMANAR
jgi:hypothetical protein